MTAPISLTPERVRELVMGNRVLRSPAYVKHTPDGALFSEPEKGLQWLADAIPALLGLFRVERDPRDDRPDGWIGFAVHWRGTPMRLDFDVRSGDDGQDPVLVVTEMFGFAPEDRIEVAGIGTVDFPTDPPSKREWTARTRRYQSERADDDEDATAAVHAFVAELPTWQRELARRVDALVEREVPQVIRAVKWHAPFYGTPELGWIVQISATPNKLKVTFMAGASFDPKPPGGRRPDARWLDLSEGDVIDEVQLVDWIRQAASMPGWFAS